MSMSSSPNLAPFYVRWLEEEHLAREAHEDLARRGAWNLFETQIESLNTFHSDLLRITQHAPSSLASRVLNSLSQIVMDWQRLSLERQRDRAIASAGPAPSRSFESWLDEKILVDGDKEAAAALEAYHDRQWFESMRDIIPDVTDEQVARQFTPEAIAARKAYVDEVTAERVAAVDVPVEAQKRPVYTEWHQGIPVATPVRRKMNDGRGEGRNMGRTLERKVVGPVAGGRF